MNFVDIHPHTIKPLIGEQTFTPVETFDLHPVELPQEEEESLCVGSCSIGSEVVCPDETGYFKIENLFAELKTEYDKLMARKNLGIATSDTLRWGNILGNLVNQKDVVNFITEQVSASKQSVLDIVQKQIDELDTQSSITTLYYGPSLSELVMSNSTTFKTGDYEGKILVAVPNYPTVFTVNGLNGGFNYTGSIDVGAQHYYVYESEYSGLGATEITVTYG